MDPLALIGVAADVANKTYQAGECLVRAGRLQLATHAPMSVVNLLSKYEDDKYLSFRNSYSFEQRFEQCQTFMAKNPGKILISLQKLRGSSTQGTNSLIVAISQKSTLTQMLFHLEKNILKMTNLTNSQLATKAVFFFTDQRSMIISSTITYVKDFYNEHCDRDGILYLYFAEQEVFG